MSTTDTGIGSLAHNAAEQAEEFVRKVWKGCHFHALPQWLQDNDYLHTGHRPPLNSFWACFQSIFRVHTETVNIWTHLLGKKCRKKSSNKSRTINVLIVTKLVVFLLRRLYRFHGNRSVLFDAAVFRN